MAYETPDALAKSARFHIRATDRQAKLIRAGAQRKGLKLTDYIVDTLCAQAEMDLAGQNRFVLPKVPAGLKRLFSRVPVAESR
jgi:uncharacterized protein (DUF1778 family)